MYPCRIFTTCQLVNYDIYQLTSGKYIIYEHYTERTMSVQFSDIAYVQPIATVTLAATMTVSL